MELRELVSWLNDYLKLGDFPQDQSLNGLQVEANEDVNKIAVSVDAGLEVFRRAKKLGADLLIVHHGILWKGVDPFISGVLSHRVRFLLENSLSLYAVHLPLDAHPEVGNNITICRLLGLEPVERIGIGYLCKEADFLELKEKVEEKIGKILRSLEFGPGKGKVYVVSGGGTFDILQNLNKAKIFVTGELNHAIYHYAKEAGVNIIEAGHYATERFGVIELAKKIEEKFGIPWEFIDVPTGF